MVLVAPIEGMIDMGLAPFVERVLKTGESEGVAAVVFDINTFGGRVDAAVAIRDHILRSPVPTVAHINKRAISAGALISLATKTILMADGGTMGAATPVQMGQPGEEAKPVGEKTVSYVRKEFRATADARKRPGTLAEAMVDPDVEVSGVIEKGKLLTLTTSEALEHKLADGQADDMPAVLRFLKLENAELRRLEQNWAETVVRFLTHPAISSLLMTLAILGIVLELRMPGFGVPGIVGLLSLTAFFWGHALVRLVGWEQLLLVGVGVVLLFLEVFVIPGFGVAGVLGIAAIVAGLTSSLFGAGATWQAMLNAGARVLISAGVAAVGAMLLMRFIPSLPFGRKLVLGTALSGASEAVAARSWLGVIGTALTPLRPSGTALLQGHRVDVVSEGQFISAGAPIKVVLHAGHRVVVEPHHPDAPTTTSAETRPNNEKGSA